MEHRTPVKRKARMLTLCKLLFIVTAIAVIALGAFTSGWFTSWVTSATLNKMHDGSWVNSIDDSLIKVYQPVMEINDAEVQVIYAAPKPTDANVDARTVMDTDEMEEMGDRTLLKDPQTKEVLFTVDREFVRNLPLGQIIDESGELTDESFRITVTDVKTHDRAEIIPFSLNLKDTGGDGYATMDAGASPTYYFQWNNNSRAVLKTSTDGDMELVWPGSNSEIERANDFLTRFSALYGPALKAQRDLSLDDEDIYVPPSDTEITRSTGAIRHFTSADGKRSGWYAQGSCWVTNCRPISVTTLVIVKSRNKCGLWIAVAKWVISIIPAKCHQCSHCNARCNGYPASDDRGCSNHGKCVRGKCQCSPGFTGSKCSSCTARYDGSSYPRCNKCLPKYAGNNCQGCADGYWPAPLCNLKRKCGKYYFDDSKACSGHGRCSSGISLLGSCTCSNGWTGRNCDSCAANFQKPHCNKCVDGYKGSKCNERVKCGSRYFNAGNVCNNKGTCKITNGVGRCECDAGWTGADCTLQVTKCFGKEKTACTVCSGKGNCVATDTCQCNRGYKGDQCERTVTCNTIPFSNPASCTSSSHGSCNTDTETCDCINGWSGEKCDVPTCTNNCNGRGTCTGVNSCTCSSGFYGASCEFEYTCNGKGMNDPAVCSGNGACSTNGKCTCNDPTKWGGNDCELRKCNDVLENEGHVCGGKGACGSDFQCRCDEKYSGVNCETPLTCNGVPYFNTTAVCSGNGDCQLNGECLCSPEFDGPNCDACKNPRRSYASKCTACIAPFVGANCDECEAGFSRESQCTECQSGYFKVGNACVACDCDVEGSTGATCDTDGKCQCKEGHFGSSKCDVCEDGFFKVDGKCQPCNCNPEGSLLSTCLHDGTCTCDKTFYSGDKCEVKVQCNGVDFDQGACSGNGNCTIDGCSCNDGWKGDDCSIPVCFGVPAGDGVCSSHGRCVAPDSCKCDAEYGDVDCGLPMTCDGVPFYETKKVCSGKGDCDGSFGDTKCKCQSGFGGDNCEKCELDNFSYDSECKDCVEGYDGKNCDQCAQGFFRHNNSCVPCGCRDGGECNDEGQCNCAKGTYGLKCENDCNCHPTHSVHPDECSSEGICTCLTGFYGEKCDNTYICNEFASDLAEACSGNGKCVGNDTCVCDEGFTGPFCEKSLTPRCNGLTGRAGCNDNGECREVDGEDTCVCDHGFEGPSCETKSILCYGLPGRSGCSDRGNCVSENMCKCDSGLFTGKKCQVALVFEGTSSSVFSFPTTTSTPLTVYTPEIPVDAEEITAIVEIVENNFASNLNGIVLGLASFPLRDPNFHIIGRSPIEYAMSTVDGRMWTNGEPSPIRIGTVSRAVGFQIRMIYNFPAKRLELAEKLPGQTAFTTYATFPNIIPQAIIGKFKIGITSSCRTTGCVVRFVE